MDTLNISTKEKNQFIDITNKIEKVVRDRKIKSGCCYVFCPHTTAALTINENADPSVVKDIIKHLNKLVPNNGGFSHSEGNSDAHIKSSLLGESVSILVENSQLVLGTWQGIYFCEFDGPRNRQVFVKVIER